MNVHSRSNAERCMLLSAWSSPCSRIITDPLRTPRCLCEEKGGTNVRIRILLALAALGLLSVSAQSANAASKSAHANIVNAQGTQIGTAKFSPAGAGVKVSVKVSQLTPGEHGIHVHA